MKKQTHAERLEQEERAAKAQRGRAREDLVAQLGHLEQAAAEANARAEAVRVELARADVAAVALDEAPDLAPVTEEPDGALLPVLKVFPGANAKGEPTVYDLGSLVDPDTVPNFAVLQSLRGGSTFGLIAVHPRAVVARGRLCRSCSVLYRDAASAAAHWRSRHGAAARARAAANRERDEREEAERTAYREQSARLLAPYERWGAEVRAQRDEARNPKPLSEGYPIDRDEIARNVAGRKPGGGGDLPPAA